MTPLPNRIREHRKAKKMTQDGLGTCINVSGVQISRMERGERNVSMEQMKRFARILGCSAAHLLPPDAPPPDVEEIAALAAQLTPEDRAVLKRVAEALHLGRGR